MRAHARTAAQTYICVENRWVQIQQQRHTLMYKQREKDGEWRWVRAIETTERAPVCCRSASSTAPRWCDRGRPIARSPLPLWVKITPPLRLLHNVSSRICYTFTLNPSCCKVFHYIWLLRSVAESVKRADVTSCKADLLMSEMTTVDQNEAAFITSNAIWNFLVLLTVNVLIYFYFTLWEVLHCYQTTQIIIISIYLQEESVIFHSFRWAVGGHSCTVLQTMIRTDI